MLAHARKDVTPWSEPADSVASSLLEMMAVVEEQ
jgi:hypothetical protein